nr:lanthionine synthetase LanC family protein [Frankia casuarinae]
MTCSARSSPTWCFSRSRSTACPAGGAPTAQPHEGRPARWAWQPRDRPRHHGPRRASGPRPLDGVRVDGQEQALRTICQWLDTWRRPASEGSWWPEFVTLDDLDRGEPRQRGPLRPSWCYGAPGIARTQQLAARALGDTTREHLAETAFAACIRDPAQLARLTEPGLCHGTAGLLATARRIAADARTPIALAPLLRLHQDTAAAADASPGFLDGSAGAELAVAGTTTSWDACLLLC